MTNSGKDILIGLDAGTSVIKSVAFDLQGRQLALASKQNQYKILPDGGAVQDMASTWLDCAATLRDLAEMCENLATRVLGISVTAQGDGMWLVGAQDAPVTDGWIWLDSRSAKIVDDFRGCEADIKRYAITATGLNCCQMGAQMMYLEQFGREALDRAETALHPKDWLFLNLTGVRATDPSEAVFTFGNYRTSAYDDTVIESLGLSHRKSLLPPITDGSKETHPLSDAAAAETGLLAGTPVSLGVVDVVCTALGAGILADGASAGCTIVGSTGMHMKACHIEEVTLNDDLTGYVMQLPIEGMVSQIQSNMASTLNLDWLLDLALGLTTEFGLDLGTEELVKRIDHWLTESAPAQMIYHPYISEAGERGPFVDAKARASFTGLRQSHKFGDLVRAVIEGLGLAARDCYAVMGEIPDEIRLTGGAARSAELRSIFSAVMNRPVRYSSREEAGAAGAAMMAAVANGAYDTMHSCIADWVTPLLGESEHPDSGLAEKYNTVFGCYVDQRLNATPVWEALTELQEPVQ
jgi:erythritol kinase